MGNDAAGADGFVYFESEEALQMAVSVLIAMAPAARKLLAECIEHQELVRTKASAAAQALEAAGFVFISDLDGYFSSAVRIRPSLAGEEAMVGLDGLRQKAKGGKSQT